MIICVSTIKKRLTALLTALALTACFALFPAQGTAAAEPAEPAKPQAAPLGKSQYEALYQAAGNYLARQNTVLAPAMGSEWAFFGLARAGYPLSQESIDNYRDAISDYVKENSDDAGRLHAGRSTDNSRVILALTALGLDAENIGGRSLLAGLTDLDYVKKQGLNGPVWALIAFDSRNYAIPANETAAAPTTREALVACILDAQLSDGGWTYFGDESDAEMTSIVLSALAPYYRSDEKVRTAADTALAKLSALQNPDGSFSSWGEVSSETCAQVLVALTSLGIDPEADGRFVKNGGSILDALLAFCTDNGGFCHTTGGEANTMSSEQGYYALAAYYRFTSGKTRLYDMSDIASGKTTPEDGENRPTQGTQDNLLPKDPAMTPSTAKESPATGIAPAACPYLALLLLSQAALTLAAMHSCDKKQKGVRF